MKSASAAWYRDESASLATPRLALVGVRTKVRAEKPVRAEN